MRIDLISATAAALAAAQSDSGQSVAEDKAARRTGQAERTVQAQQTAQADKAATQAEQPQAKPSTAVPPVLHTPSVLNVTFDQDKNTIYRFVDEQTGKLVRQIPPDEVLRIMRGVEEMLQQSEPEQKLKVTL